MKLIVFLALALAFVVCVAQAQPLAEVALEEVALEEVPHSRQKRVTCDLLSHWNWNDTACAAHCILIGKRGGYCSNKGVCICR